MDEIIKLLDQAETTLQQAEAVLKALPAFGEKI